MNDIMLKEDELSIQERKTINVAIIGWEFTDS